MESFLILADLSFVLFHSALTIFNALGWVFRKTRKWNLITLILTGLSWTVLGLFYGLGYCPLTDWHFQILRKLGEENLPSSYIEYLAERISGLRVSAELADTATGIVFIVALGVSATLNIRDQRKKRQN